MSGDSKQPAGGLARRDVLKGLGVAGAATTGQAEAQQPSTRETRDERTKARYQPNSPDVQAFYRTNRY